MCWLTEQNNKKTNKKPMSKYILSYDYIHKELIESK